MAISFPAYGLLCPFYFSLGYPWPICFLRASLTLLLTLHSHELLLTSLSFPGPITLFSSLGFMGLSLTLYFIFLHYFGLAMVHSHFSISYTTHGYAISLFPGFLKPICLLKAHLFTSWVCDPLFLLLGPNGFATCLPTTCCPCSWAFFLLLGFSKWPSTYSLEGLRTSACLALVRTWKRVCEGEISHSPHLDPNFPVKSPKMSRVLFTFLFLRRKLGLALRKMGFKVPFCRCQFVRKR